MNRVLAVFVALGLVAILSPAEPVTKISPKVREAKYAKTYPPQFHEAMVATCVDAANDSKAPPEIKKLAPVLCDCTFWNIEDNFTWDQFRGFSQQQLAIIFEAALNGCAIELDKKSNPPQPDTKKPKLPKQPPNKGGFEQDPVRET